MTEEKVENTQTITEETNVNVDSASAGADVKVSTEKTVEHATEKSSDDSRTEDVQTAASKQPETNVNVKVENNVPSAQPQPQNDPHKNYEAAQPVVDPIV